MLSQPFWAPSHHPLTSQKKSPGCGTSDQRHSCQIKFHGNTRLSTMAAGLGVWGQCQVAVSRFPRCSCILQATPGRPLGSGQLETGGDLVWLGRKLPQPSLPLCASPSPAALEGAACLLASLGVQRAATPGPRQKSPSSQASVLAPWGPRPAGFLICQPRTF